MVIFELLSSWFIIVYVCSQGQLGLGDNTTRLRPEPVRAIRNALAQSIAAGKQHSMVISPKGALFAFGSNSHGQLGLGEDAPDLRFVSSPTVVEKLREHYVVQVACGAAHTLVLCESRPPASSSGSTARPTRQVYAMGLNSSGQLGLGHCQNVRSPTLVPLGPDVHVSTVVSGALAFHSFILTSDISMDIPRLPSVNLDQLRGFAEHVKASSSVDSLKLMHVRESVAAAFSSISVMNSSFRDSLTVGKGFSLSLKDVREAYTLICETNNAQLLATLSRSTLHLTEQLRECPFDDPESLSVFFIVFENPLLLQPSNMHIVLQRFIAGILALPKSYRVLLFSWLKKYEPEYLIRVVQVLQNFLSFACEDKVTRLDCSPTVMVLDSVFQSNKEARIIPESAFYNKSMSKSFDIAKEWSAYKSTTLKSVFNICAYPFLLDVDIKNTLLMLDIGAAMFAQNVDHVQRYIIRPLQGATVTIPSGTTIIQGADAGINAYFDIRVDREHIVEQTLNQLYNILLDDPSTLKLPLRVFFNNEDAVDRGGVTREFFGILVKQLFLDKDVFSPCNDVSDRWDRARMLWFRRATSTINNERPTLSSDDSTDSKRPKTNENIFSREYIIGLVVGLAFYHRVLVHFPLPPHLFALARGDPLSLTDLAAVDPTLARSLSSLGAYEDNVTLQSDVGATFVASKNPLISQSLETADNSIELLKDGANIAVTSANRADFIDLFVAHALYRCCKEAVDDFIAGMVRIITDLPVISVISSSEFEKLLAGSSDLGDFDELHKYTTYAGEFHGGHDVIQWFWNIVKSMSESERRQLLQFATGCDRVPIGGVASLGFKIQSTAQPPNALPSAHTCFSMLNIPNTYADQDMLKNRLLEAIQHCHGFGFV
jgi:hypothetical protein